MAAIDNGNLRIANHRPQPTRKRAAEFLMLTAASLAFLFTLAIAVGLISG